MLEGYSSKKELIIASTEIDTISKSDIYDTYKDLYLSKKTRRMAGLRHTAGQ